MFEFVGSARAEALFIEWSHTKASPIPINCNTMRSRERTVNFDAVHLPGLGITKESNTSCILVVQYCHGYCFTFREQGSSLFTFNNACSHVSH